MTARRKGGGESPSPAGDATAADDRIGDWLHEAAKGTPGIPSGMDEIIPRWLDHLRQRAEEDSNPLYVWEAIHRCQGWGLPWPDWCKDYIATVATGLINLREQVDHGNTTPGKACESVPELLKLRSGKKGAANAFERHSDDERAMVHALMADMSEQELEGCGTREQFVEDLRRGKNANSADSVERYLRKGATLRSARKFLIRNDCT